MPDGSDDEGGDEDRDSEGSEMRNLRRAGYDTDELVERESVSGDEDEDEAVDPFEPARDEEGDEQPEDVLGYESEEEEDNLYRG